MVHISPRGQQLTMSAPQAFSGSSTAREQHEALSVTELALKFPQVPQGFIQDVLACCKWSMAQAQKSLQVSRNVCIQCPHQFFKTGEVEKNKYLWTAVPICQCIGGLLSLCQIMCSGYQAGIFSWLCSRIWFQVVGVILYRPKTSTYRSSVKILVGRHLGY